MSRKVLRTALVASMVLLMALLGHGPAFASPLTSATARAYGASIDLLGVPAVAPLPEVTAGPGPGQDSGNVLPVALSSLIGSGTVGARAQTTLESVLPADFPSGSLRVFSPAGTPIPPAYNARAYSRVEGLSIVSTTDTTNVINNVVPIVDLPGQVVPALVAADLIDAVAMVSCVEGRPVIVGGSRLAGVNVLGTSLSGLVDGTLNQVVSLGNTILSALGGSIIANEVVSQGPDNVSINALHVRIPGVLDTVLAHSEVRGAVCQPLAAPPAPQLVRTGGWGAGYGLAILAGGGLLALAAYGLRRWRIQDNI